MRWVCLVVVTCDKKSHWSSRQREQVSNAHPQTRHASLVTVGCEARAKAFGTIPALTDKDISLKCYWHLIPLVDSQPSPGSFYGPDDYFTRLAVEYLPLSSVVGFHAMIVLT